MLHGENAETVLQEGLGNDHAVREGDAPAEEQEPMPLVRLVQLFRSTDPRLRSKLARLTGRYKQYESFVARRVQEDDPRVRANAIESLWNIATPTIRKLLQAATRDTHHRVSVNALIGLYLLGDTASVAHLLQHAGHAAPNFRAAAAWGMGQTGDPRFLPILKTLAGDSDETVRRAAATAAARVEETLAKSRQGKNIGLKILCAHGADNQWRHLTVVLQDEDAGAVPPTSFVVEENGRGVSNFEAKRITARTPTRIGVALPDQEDRSEWAASAEAILTSELENGHNDCAASVRYKLRAQASSPGAESHATISPGHAPAPAGPQRRENGTRDLRHVLMGLTANVAKAPERALLMIADTGSSGNSILEYCLTGDVLSELRNRRIRLHAIAPADGEGNPLRAMCAATGGVFLPCPAAEELKDALAVLFRSFEDRFEVRYSAEQKFVAGSSVKLAVFAQHGWGEDSYILL